MKINLTSKVFLLTITFLAFSSSISACPLGAEEMASTENIFSTELIWGLFIILLHMVMGLVHTWLREKKTKKEPQV
jgi:cytochrome b561